MSDRLPVSLDYAKPDGRAVPRWVVCTVLGTILGVASFLLLFLIEVLRAPYRPPWDMNPLVSGGLRQLLFVVTGIVAVIWATTAAFLANYLGSRLKDRS